MLITSFKLVVKNRKGLDKPIFLVASIALVIMVIAIYFASVNGLFQGGIDEIIGFTNRNSPSGSDIG